MGLCVTSGSGCIRFFAVCASPYIQGGHVGLQRKGVEGSQPDPLLAKSPNGVRGGVRKRRSGRRETPDRVNFGPHCRTYLGYASGEQTDTYAGAPYGRRRIVQAQ